MLLHLLQSAPVDAGKFSADTLVSKGSQLVETIRTTPADQLLQGTLSSVAKFGLKPVEGVVGKPLDTATSEAITIMRTGQAEPGCVVYETRRGYFLNGKVLRAAQVVVEDEADSAEAAPAPAAVSREAGSVPEASASGSEAGSASEAAESPDGRAPSRPDEEA